ncbi:putative 17.5 kDa protein in tk-vs intergenic region [Porphyridium purpureum]|uniref:Putative 17.5 kDa protein in tk-vs intergenic region n=1 Tax=Porphyridium purpureum TaxID=35688 RepID=A0A5J4YTU0_PORPP|nr:putative 17.5 kDa protein in tk-vs intergenic region [Porphyridium purpureum]|eukprot:POR2172..scf227_4
MRIIQGDLIALAKAGRFDVIVHGCNCHCKMGGGIARVIKVEFPAAFAADLRTRDVKPDERKLGTISFARIDLPLVEGSQSDGPSRTHTLTVVNAYTQNNYSGAKVLVDYENGIRPAFRLIKEQFGGQMRRIGYPKIGAGLGGGDWAIIAQIIDEELAGEDHTLVELAA